MRLSMGTRSLAPQTRSVVEESDARAIERSCSEPEAFVVVFERHFDAVHRYVHRRLGRDLADELASETFARAYHRRASYEARFDNALPWLYGIAANIVRRHRRTEVRRLRAYARSGVDQSVDLDEASVVERADAIRHGAAIAAELGSLSADDRETLTLVAFADLTYEEVGQALGIPAGTVASRMNRLRGQLSSRLSEDRPPREEEPS
jgi:RNA polymerase sigma-70 factor, ECF subfamily